MDAPWFFVRRGLSVFSGWIARTGAPTWPDSVAGGETGISNAFSGVPPASLLAAAVMAAAVQPAPGQSFQMSMEDVVSWGGMIVVARVDSIDRTRTFESEVMTCHVVPFSSLLPHEEPLSPFEGIYTRLEPGIFFDEDGNQSTEWPLVTGSGYEDLVTDGDTAIVFLRTREIAPEIANGILRIEPMASVRSLVDHIVETAE